MKKARDYGNYKYYMKNIIDIGDIFKYIWQEKISDEFISVGCEICSLKAKNSCPIICDKNNGYYRYMDSREMKYVEIEERWKKKHKIKQ